ncbi:uncharacterized protein F5891DRAFT_986459 [Suillus fuscotomentosus]|uniref:Uncharacterized protein n=1 Tax=Suillus fuscotomentosus TaxID=1912939 RepID=A0AAD4DS47_9AGAM|nr:uncharacterized protein F5891DRAFT_986459 [Suillus fuscotomentosus]KAG1891901.1 hypothetical protein F5891DRAFT_986459 [Suillus fuscotomentosus]
MAYSFGGALYFVLVWEEQLGVAASSWSGDFYGGLKGRRRSIRWHSDVRVESRENSGSTSLVRKVSLPEYLKTTWYYYRNFVLKLAGIWVALGRELQTTEGSTGIAPAATFSGNQAFLQLRKGYSGRETQLRQI